MFLVKRAIDTVLASAIAVLVIANVVAYTLVWDRISARPTASPVSSPSATPVIVQVEAPEDDWGFRSLAMEADTRIPELHIIVTGSCEERPEAVCVTVHADDYGALNGKTGWTNFYDYATEVWLNAHDPSVDRLEVAARELDKVLASLPLTTDLREETS